jgi:hypothetical protein
MFVVPEAETESLCQAERKRSKPAVGKSGKEKREREVRYREKPK